MISTLRPWKPAASIAITHARLWTCRQCLQSQQRQQLSTQLLKTRSFSAGPQNASQAGKRAWRQRVKLTREQRRVAIGATAIFVVGAGALAFSEDARHFYIAAERTGRVAVTLAVCINDYRQTLKKAEDPNYQALLSACHQRCADRTLKAIEKNGSIFIKLGQHLTSLNYLLPNEWCDTFIPLQDQCPVSSFSSVDEMVKQDTGKSLEEYFSEFSPRPIGAASLAQVHTATLRDTGEKVAVKVQHPALDEWAKLDLALTRFTFRTLKRFFPEYDLTWLGDEMDSSLPKELDFREEGHNARRMKEYFSHVRNSPLVIPDVIWAQRRILVMQYIAGHRLDDLDFLDANGMDRDEVSAALARIFNEMIFGHGAPLHCDPHGGNLAIRVNPHKRRPRNFDVILYDHGLYRDIPADLRCAYAHLWLAVLDSDEPRMRKYAWEVAGIGDDEFPIFASAITGRDFAVVQKDVATKRNSAEKRNITAVLGQGNLIEQLVRILGKVPRIILLILKTNDLTRSLDEHLHTRQGPLRSFMILARYAARTVFEDQVAAIRGSFARPDNLLRYALALTAYAKIAIKLRIYEYYLRARRRLGLVDSFEAGEMVQKVGGQIATKV